MPSAMGLSISRKLGSPLGAMACLALAVAVAGPTMRAQSELVLAKEGSKEFHRPGCDVVKDGKGVLALTRGQAAARGLTAHPGCDPAQTAPPEPGTSAPPSTVYVYIDSSRYYHKRNCAKLGKDPKKTDLEEAGKRLWPCPTCKPPIRKRQR